MQPVGSKNCFDMDFNAKEVHIQENEKGIRAPVWHLSRSFKTEAGKKQWHYLAPGELRPLADGVLKLINTVSNQGSDAVFFLDKSARPIAHLFSRTWRRIKPAHFMPQPKFFETNPFEERNLDGFTITPQEALVIKQTYGNLDGKRVCVVDEYSASNRLLRRLKIILESTYPRISSVVTTKIFDDRLPMWHGRTELLGIEHRGVGLRDIANFQLPSEHDSVPKILLSKPSPSVRSTQFRHELTQLADVIAKSAKHTRVSSDRMPSYTKEVIIAS